MTCLHLFKNLSFILTVISTVLKILQKYKTELILGMNTYFKHKIRKSQLFLIDYHIDTMFTQPAGWRHVLFVTTGTRFYSKFK